MKIQKRKLQINSYIMEVLTLASHTKHIVFHVPLTKTILLVLKYLKLYINQCDKIACNE